MAQKDLNNVMKTVIESDLFEYLGLDSLPDEKKVKVMEELMISLRARVIIRIADFLESKGTYPQFKELTEKDDTTDIIVTKFLEDNKVPVDVFTGEEALLLKTEIMGLKDNQGAK